MMCVACILIHDQTMHRTLFPSFVIHDFVRSVHLDAQPNHAQNVIYPFRAFMMCVACILMHDQIMHRTLFTPFGHSRFRATSCTLRFKKNPSGQKRVRILFSQEDYFNPAAARKSAARSIFSQGNCSRPKWP